MVLFLGSVMVAAGFAATAGALAPGSADEVMRKAVARAQAPPTRGDASSFSYTKVTVTEQLDAAGKVRDQKRKVWQVFLRSGQASTRLLEVNGHPPQGRDLKSQNENDLNLRQLMGNSNTSASPNTDTILTPELVERYVFSLAGETILAGRKTWQIEFEPKSPEPPVHRMLDRLLNQVSGTLWIDAQEYEIARADIRLRSEVNLLGGVIGCLKKLAYTLTRVRLAEGVWVNSVSTGNFEGRKLLDSMRVRTHSQTSDFKPLAQN